MIGYNHKYGPLPEATKTGHTLVGWFTEDEGNGSLIHEEDNYTFECSHTFYAFWAVSNNDNKPAFDLGKGVTCCVVVVAVAVVVCVLIVIGAKKSRKQTNSVLQAQKWTTEAPATCS